MKKIVMSIIMYLFGRGTTRNYKKLIIDLKKSANQGNTWAQINLGYLYYNGKGGVEQDYRKAYIWSLIAQKSSSSKEHKNLIGDDVAKINLTANY